VLKLLISPFLARMFLATWVVLVGGPIMVVLLLRWSIIAIDVCSICLSPHKVEGIGFFCKSTKGASL